MKVTFLGTGTSQGVPVIACNCEVCTSLDFKNKRTRTSVHIQRGSLSIIIDIGPDFRQQVLREGIDKLDALLLTHEHKDHTAGLDEVRSFNFTQNKDMPVYGRKSVLSQLKREYEYIFGTVKYPGIPSIELLEIKNKPFSVLGQKIIPVEVMHHKLPVFGFRIENFVYITDANHLNEIEKLKLIDAEILVINALQLDDHISHFTLAQALALIKEVKPKQAYLTHISHHLGLANEVEAILPENVSLAYDGLSLTTGA